MAQTNRSALDVLAQIMGSEPMARMRKSSHFSSSVYSDEPIITTGRQMRSYVPDRIRQMKELSRYEQGRGGRQGRWLSDSEYFHLQGTFMEDFEDDCPYHGTFKSYYPTYNDMSDQQLRGYFTWRAQVRRGNVEETSLSFAYVYLYELLNGIGVESPLDGFHKIERFWQEYREFSPELDRFARTWLVDYAVYHGLDPELLAGSKAASFDRALIALRDAGTRARSMAPARRTKNAPPTIPLPADAALEDALFDAIAELSTYRVKASRFYKTHPEGFRHVACAVYVRLSIYYERQRKKGLIESWFGEVMELPYTMFGSAVFYEPKPHEDAVYHLSGLTTYRCNGGSWTCERPQGGRTRSGKLGQVMRAVDRKMREAYGFAYPLKDDGKTPKYLDQIMDQEIGVWRAWEEAHAPREVKIDLGQLSGIRSAAAKTRESLLTDEERGEDAGAGEDDRRVAGAKEAGAGTAVAEPVVERNLGTAPAADGGAMDTPPLFGPDFEDGGTPAEARARGSADTRATPQIAGATPVKAGIGSPRSTLPETPTATGEPVSAGPLDEQQATYLRCLLEDAPPRERDRAVAASGLSEDMLVDAINEAFLDLVGDTVIEFGPEGPELIEDYLEDVGEAISHG